MANTEAAFLGNVENGEQFPFTRLRIRMDVPAIGTYTVIHPYGQEVLMLQNSLLEMKLE